MEWVAGDAHSRRRLRGAIYIAIAALCPPLVMIRLFDLAHDEDPPCWRTLHVARAAGDTGSVDHRLTCRAGFTLSPNRVTFICSECVRWKRP